MMPELTRAQGVPRLAGISYPLSRPLGMPGDADGQLAVLKTTLEILDTAKTPDTYVELPFEWPQTPSQARKETEVHPNPPIVDLLKRKPWLLAKFYSGDIPEET